MKVNGIGRNISNSINEFQMRFYYMSSDERIEFINQYNKMQAFQKVALRQCRTIMSPAEKKAFRKISILDNENCEQNQLL